MVAMWLGLHKTQALFDGCKKISIALIEEALAPKAFFASPPATFAPESPV